jgi:hypothetical protein
MNLRLLKRPLGNKYLYDQNKGREIFQKSWKDKKKEKLDQRKKGFKPPFFKKILIHINKVSQLRVNPRW